MRISDWSSDVCSSDLREKTGLGQYIELSQIEATTMLLTPQLLEYQISGVEQERRGTEKPESILHGVYPCDGDERWIAIEVENDQQWAGLLRVLRRKAMPQSQIGRASCRERVCQYV